MSANAKHTPGPWKVLVEDDSVLISTEAEGSLCVDCTRSSGKDHAHDIANGDLIAEAPALLAALKDCAELMEDFRNANGAGPKSCGHVFPCICASDRFEAAKSAAHAAIARAEGGKP